ncbi:f-box/wd repeat-containing protein pof1 [Anaeramoeba ignava]|uniref:F-box/wd repeat-containing protein pof1 n=1 Tax=Anaeramoeba ignava TaxID=1746090 RepID=A0A9Q0L9R7_ANAIG|nr:f-box/wd repeat-containing protein pof1 [Anaeramoeba ignava]|eukprot:Anaeramoba_ignava/a352636_84.p1 GENE.a352636_84~~a352636_84.p1  ORF type:complete len:763 (-),score=140.12 a352636_84:517-2760(-)
MAYESARYTLEPRTVLSGHTDRITSIALDEKTVWTSSFDNTVKQWEKTMGKNIKTLTGHTGKVLGVRFHQGEIYSFSQDATIRSWETQGLAKVKQVYSGHKGRITTVEFSGNRIFSGSADNTVKIWDISSGKCEHTFSGHSEQITSILTEKNVIYTSSTDKTVQTWDAETGQCTNVFVGHTSWVSSLTLHNGLLCTVANDGTIRSWDPSSGICVQVIEAHRVPITRAIFHDNLVYTAAYNGEVGVFNFLTSVPVHVFKAHTEKVSDILVKDNRLFTCSRDKTLRVWNTKNFRCDYAFQGSKFPLTCMAVTEGAIFTGGDDKSAIQWPGFKGKKIVGVKPKQRKPKYDPNTCKKPPTDALTVNAITKQYDVLKKHIEEVIKITEQFCKSAAQQSMLSKVAADSLVMFGENLEEEFRDYEHFQEQNKAKNSEQQNTPQKHSSNLLDSTNISSAYKHQDLNIGESLIRFGELQQNLDTQKEKFYQNVLREFSTPLKNFILILKKAKQPVKILESAWKEYSQKRRKDEARGTLAAIVDFSDVKTKFELAKLDAKKKFEEIHLFMNLQFLGSLCSIMNHQLRYHKRAYDMLCENYNTIFSLESRTALLDGKRSSFILQKNLLPVQEKKSKENPKGKYITTSSYKAQNEYELTFEPNMIITLVYKRVNYSVGSLDSKIGLFPNALVSPVGQDIQELTSGFGLDSLVDSETIDSEPRTETETDPRRTTDLSEENLGEFKSSLAKTTDVDSEKEK